MIYSASEIEEKLRNSAASGDAATVQEIIKYNQIYKAGINFSAPDALGRTPLHFSACAGFLPICKLLISQNCEVSCCDRRGNSPLHLATLGNKSDVVMLLIEEGKANPIQTDAMGKTPFIWLTERFQNYHLSSIKQNNQTDLLTISLNIKNNLSSIIRCMETWISYQSPLLATFSPSDQMKILQLQSQIEKLKEVCYQIDKITSSANDDSLDQLESLLSGLSI